MDHNIANIRYDYQLKGLLEADLDADPLKQFRLWFNEVREADISEANAMLLSTVYEGRPTGRIVLLKDLDNRGFSFFTNYDSKKGREIEANPQVALTFFWKELERQVRIEGRITKTSESESSEYFAIRPRGSQIGAWASPQSVVIKDRSLLEARVKDLEEKHKDDKVLPRPKQWGGYAVAPFEIEFWQGRASRLHDRILYTLIDKEWKINRLAP